MLLHVRLDFYGQYVVDADAKVVQSVDVFPTELNYLCATFFDHRGYGKLQGLKRLAILDEPNNSTFLVDLHSKRRHLMPPDVDAEPTLIRGHN